MADMKCPQCESPHVRKNGFRNGQQRYQCKACGKQFLEPTSTQALLTALGDAVQFESSGHSESAPVLSILQASAPSAPGIAILLLDAENLKLDIKTEKFLASLCASPLQVKIAFANWRNQSLGKLDAELHERGYQLVHAPDGKNSADAKMIAVGSSIFLHYPNVKEVFVCSSDGLLNHLCTQLQNLGMTVYRARTKNKALTVENRRSGELKQYSLTVEAEIPSFEGFVKQVEELIQAEHNSLTERIAQFSAISALFQERRNLTLNASRSNDSPTSVPEALESFTALTLDRNSSNYTVSVTVSHSSEISTRDELEQALVKLVRAFSAESAGNYISLSNLARKFQKEYGQPLIKTMRQLGLGSKFPQFLQSCSAFKVQRKSKGYQVALA
jgi:hypothetical protein